MTLGATAGWRAGIAGDPVARCGVDAGVGVAREVLTMGLEERTGCGWDWKGSWMLTKAAMAWTAPLYWPWSRK